MARRNDAIYLQLLIISLCYKYLCTKKVYGKGQEIGNKEACADPCHRLKEQAYLRTVCMGRLRTRADSCTHSCLEYWHRQPPVHMEHPSIRRCLCNFLELGHLWYLVDMRTSSLLLNFYKLLLRHKLLCKSTHLHQRTKN